VELVLKSITVEEVNEVAAEICEHLTKYGVAGAPPPSACVATCPAYMRDRETGEVRPFDISEEDMLRVRACVRTYACLCCPARPYFSVLWSHVRGSQLQSKLTVFMSCTCERIHSR
jgi:hypothetical protein